MECYCLFCKSGQEGAVIALLERSGRSAFSPYAVRVKLENGTLRRSRSRLLPGYVFFESEDQPDWERIRRYSGVLKALRYEDGNCALRGEDLAFVHWLKRYGGVVDVSQVIKVGTKISFVGGPLVGMDAKVLKVNKSRRQVQIALGDGEALFHNIWCSIEYIEGNTDFDRLQRESPEPDTIG
ncbi:MAG: transcription termination/antitermination NusG family protein [Clostridia bacterium]|nr:transcription termination/antitermination NusG family protein [Clostridia bacterium]